MRQKPAKVVPMTRRGNAASTTVPPSATVAERRAWVAEHLTMGHRPTAVAQLGAKHFGVSEHTIIRDLAAVRDQWAAESAEERPRARAEMLARIDAAHLAARTDGSHGDCARLLKLRAEVQGLVGPKSVAIAVSGTDALTDEEIHDRAAALLRRARERVADGVGSPHAE